MKEQVHFKTNVLLKNIIGKDLITDDNVAVMELVKNSYDAGAQNICVTFCNILETASEDSQIVIYDDGIGMSRQDILDKWLNIAYSEKDISSFMNGRYQAGNKGVGRFSCDKLGKELVLYSKTIDSPLCKLSVDWSLFEGDSMTSELQSIALTLEEISDGPIKNKDIPQNFKCGTVLIIKNLRGNWNRDKLLRLRRDMERFVNPNVKYETAFSLFLEAPEFVQEDDSLEDPVARINGKIENKIFDHLNFRTTSIVSEITDQGLIETKLYDRGRVVFSLSEKNIFENLEKVKITVYYLNTYAKRYFHRQTGQRSIDFGSIFLFVNGFRVPPYGDAGDDWLGMEARKASGYRRYLSAREVVGQIEIWDENNKFQIITSRTGIKNNEAFSELTKSDAPFGYFYKIFRRLERFVVEGIKWDKAKEGNQGDDKEVYELDDLSRSRRVLSVIRKIIDLKDSEIISLEINEELLQETIQNQIEHSKTEISEIVERLSSLSLDSNPEALSQYMNDLSSNAEQLKQFLNVVSSFGDTSQIGKLESVQQIIRDSESKVLGYQQQLKEKEKELEAQKQKNLYLASNRDTSQEVEDLMHTVLISSTELASLVKMQLVELEEEKLDREALLDITRDIDFNVERIHVLSSLITKADTAFLRESTDVNVYEYTKEFLDFLKRSIEIRYDDKTESDIIKKLPVLELSIILQNIVSNSKKANAKSLLITFWNEGRTLFVDFSDDGDGVDLDMYTPETIFEVGVTNRQGGSGIGLSTIREEMQRDLNGEIIFVGNGDHGLKGATFRLIFY